MFMKCANVTVGVTVFRQMKWVDRENIPQNPLIFGPFVPKTAFLKTRHPFCRVRNEL